MKRSDIVLLAALATLVFPYLSAGPTLSLAVHAAAGKHAGITIDYPRSDSIFPPEITPPTFIWHDDSNAAAYWRIEVTFADGSQPMQFESRGEPMRTGEIDPRCISKTNELPKVIPELAQAHAWTPDQIRWWTRRRFRLQQRMASRMALHPFIKHCRLVFIRFLRF
jgi:hypothetical protein